MKSLPIGFAALVALCHPAFAQDDAVAVRKALMDSVAASAAVSGGVMKGEIDYVPAIGKAAIEAINATAQSYGFFFPEGTDGETDSRSTASPKIWTDRAGFDAEIAKLQAAVGAAREAGGKDGPADAAAFAAAIEPVLGTCRSCHEGYRIKR